MKVRLILLIVFVTVSIGLTAQKQSPDWRKLHYLSAEEMLMPLNTARNFVETDPPTSEVRNVAEFDQMQSVLVRYPFGIPVELIREMAEETEVITLVSSNSQQTTVENIYASNNVNLENIAFLIAPTDSYWIRDYGPWFVFDGNKNPGIMDFPYNRPRPNDNNIPAAVAQYLNIDLYGMNVYHTGGNYMCDGMGQASSTDLVYDENPQLTEGEIALKFSDYLNIFDYHVRPDPLDDYIKHIDCWGKFLSPGKVIIGQVPESDYRFDDFEAAADYFANKISSYGIPYEVVRVYTPGTAPNTPYTNSLILNKKVFVPLTGSQWDDEAIATYEEAMPGYEVVGVMYNGWINTDALHCRTKGVADIEMLYINHIPLLGDVDYQENYEVTANIFAYSGQDIYTDSVLIYFSINNEEYQISNMSYLENDTWTGTIGGIMPGDEVDYYLYAADMSGRNNHHPYIGEPDPHEFTPIGGDVNQLEMNPDTVLFLSYEEMDEGIILNISNISSGDVIIDDITEYGEFFWYVDVLPEFPYSLAENDTLKLKVLCNIITKYYGSLISDTMYINTPLKTYKQLVMIDDELISIGEDNNITNFSIYPNPFTTNINFSFEADNQEVVKLRVFNISGQLVFQNESVSVGGKNIIRWDGVSQDGGKIVEGIYFYEINIGLKTENGKLIYTR